MGETKPYRSEKWYWHSIRDRYKPQSEWNRRNNVSLLTFIKYLCGPRYSFVQILKIASLILLAATCLLNLKLIMETSSKLENHQILLDFEDRDNIAPLDEDDYFGHYRAMDDAALKDSFEIKVRSSKDMVEVTINDEQVHYDEEVGYGRGIHITVIHESTGVVMSQRIFDTSSIHEDEEMMKFLNSISSGRILVFAVKDEASFHLGESAKEKLQRLGSALIDQLGWRSTWAMVSSAKGQNFAERLEEASDESSWGTPVEITARVDAVKNPDDVCNWPDSLESSRRALFCSKFDGYGDLCRCDNPSPVVFDTGEPLPASSVPVAVIASNRPQYLYRMLSTLLAVRGANPDNIIVFIDGQFEGYDHSCHDPTLLYRVETMPGLGWMLKRSLFEDELEPKWPTQEKVWDWDMWMRSHSIRQGRECIIPDVSRTFHFGSSGVNMGNYFFEKYFAKHAIYKKSAVAFKDVEKMSQSSYEELMHSLIQNSVLLDHSKSPCHEDFIPINQRNVSYVAYFRMPNEISIDVFLEISKCLKIWDLDARGLHKSSFRTFIKKQHVLFIGYPVSPYSVYKPMDTVPIFLKTSITKSATDL